MSFVEGDVPHSLTLDDIRVALDRLDMADSEAELFREDLYAWLNRALDEYFAGVRTPDGT